MAIALVKAGALNTGTTSAAPTFGQATTAGNFLVAWAANDGGAPGISDGTWSQAATPPPNDVGIFYKPNCGANETAPTFTSGFSVTYTSAVLAEFSDVAPTSPADRSGTTNPSTLTATNAASTADTNVSDLVVAAFVLAGTKSATATFSDSWSPAGGTAGSIANDGATKQIWHINAVYYILNGHGGGSADTDTCTQTLSTGALSLSRCQIASFLPAAASTFIAHQPFMLRQAVNRAASF